MSNHAFCLPDIGDFKDVTIIDICVKVGDNIEENQAVIILESDKASIEVPAPYAAIITNLHVKINQTINQGDLIADLTPLSLNTLSIDVEKVVSTSKIINDQPAQKQSEISKPVIATTPVNEHAVDVVVIGAGPGGYSAAFRAADLGLKTVLIERYNALGGVCLNVGCIPSKALLHSVDILDKAKHLAEHGIEFNEPTINLDKLRNHKNTIISQLTTGLAGMAKARKVEVIQGQAKFIDANHLQISDDAQNITHTKFAFKHAIIAVGSQAIELPFLPKDPRIITSTGALKLSSIPKRMLVIGGGIIGMEMATVYSSLGARIDVVEMQNQLMAGADADLVKVWQKRNQHRFDHVFLNTKTIDAKANEDGIEVFFEGNDAPKSQTYDLVLVAVGRKPNGLLIDADKAGIEVSKQGFITVDKQQRTNVANIFAIGDVVGQPMLAHKAVHEGHVASEAIANMHSYFDAKVIPSVSYTHPEIAWVGYTEAQCKAEQKAYKKAVFPWQASGRAIANGTQDGFTKLLFDENTGRIIGGSIVGDHAGDLIGEVALAIEMGADAVDIGKTIHPHPTLCESIGMAAEVAKGTCTDIPAQKK